MPDLLVASSLVGVILVAAIALARRAQLPLSFMLLAPPAIGLGGVLGATPGMFLFAAAAVVAATGPTSGTPWGTMLAIAAAGFVLGAGGGAAAACTIVPQTRRRRGARVLGAMAGACAGIAFAWPTSIAMQGLPAWYGPAVLVAAALAGAALPRSVQGARPA